MISFDFSGNTGMVAFPNESDGSGEEVIYSQESPKRDDFYRDFDWDAGCFVEYKSPLIRKETLSLVNNYSYRRNNYSVTGDSNNRIEFKNSKY